MEKREEVHDTHTNTQKTTKGNTTHMYHKHQKGVGVREREKARERERERKRGGGKTRCEFVLHYFTLKNATINVFSFFSNRMKRAVSSVNVLLVVLFPPSYFFFFNFSFSAPIFFWDVLSLHTHKTEEKKQQFSSR